MKYRSEPKLVHKRRLKEDTKSIVRKIRVSHKYFSGGENMHPHWEGPSVGDGGSN